ncbi:hypothetical protein ABMA27_004539 [Loxostege sticticalis]|uniref:MULE transposase domain-containing protein n=1 Tax=Loxostege sticticalis TaxID=481309 RepID=A0ABR3HNY3_LOXSC
MPQVIKSAMYMSDDNNVSTTDEAFTILPSQRGGKLLLYNGYRYNFRRKNQYEHAIWTCSKKNECPATLTMYKHRNRSLQAERIRFFKLKDVMIPNIYNNFLFADYNDKKTRILLFASEEGRELLKQAKEAYFPVLYGLLPNKKSTTYEIFFDLIKSQVPEFNPSVITTDFELGLMGAIQEIYPNTQSRGCLFHFSQAVWRQAKKHGLVKFKLFKPHVRRCIALSYLPIEYRNDAWLYILDSLHFPVIRVQFETLLMVKIACNQPNGQVLWRLSFKSL